jgi:large subunit ribosomal protein L3
MKKFIIGKKIGMTQIIDENSMVIPVTVIKIEESNVLKLKTKETDGYDSVVLSFGAIKESKCNKPETGVFTANNQPIRKHLKEARLLDCSKYAQGDIVQVTDFLVDEKVNVRGVTIGRGFTGTIKRWNFQRGPMTHGSKKHRGPGSIGAGTGHSKVVKGKKMSGHYGNEYVTILNLRVVKIEPEKSLLYLKGAVPGKCNNFIEIYN